MNNEILFDVFIYKNESNSMDLEVCNLQKDCIKITKFNDNLDDLRYICQISADMYQEDKYIRTELKQVIFNLEKDDWNIEGHEKVEEIYGIPSKYSIVDFFGNK